MSLSLIVAISDNNVIGRDDQLPWRLSADLQHFRRLTMGHHLIMGRKTYESIGRPLPGRTSVVLSRDPNWRPEGVIVVAEAAQAAAAVAGDSEAFVIGGSQVYRLMLPLVERIYLTRVHARVEGNVVFPEIDWRGWQLVDRQQHRASEKNEFDYSFEIYQRNEECRTRND